MTVKVELNITQAAKQDNISPNLSDLVMSKDAQQYLECMPEAHRTSAKDQNLDNYLTENGSKSDLSECETCSLSSSSASPRTSTPKPQKWIPRCRLNQDLQAVSVDTKAKLAREASDRKIKSALNKLTQNTIRPIAQEVLEVFKDFSREAEAGTLERIIDLTLMKACDEPFLSSVYAKFCCILFKEVPETVKDLNKLSKDGRLLYGENLARSVLISKCQLEYKKIRQNSDEVLNSEETPAMMSDAYYSLKAERRMQIGLFKFIGKLYVFNMLSEAVILLCLHDYAAQIEQASEGSIENFTELIKTVGFKLNKSSKSKLALNIIWSKFPQLLEADRISQRLKFILMDLQDLRRSQWIPKEIEKPKILRKSQRKFIPSRQVPKGKPQPSCIPVRVNAQDKKFTTQATQIEISASVLELEDLKRPKQCKVVPITTTTNKFEVAVISTEEKIIESDDDASTIPHAETGIRSIGGTEIIEHSELQTLAAEAENGRIQKRGAEESWTVLKMLPTEPFEDNRTLNFQSTPTKSGSGDCKCNVPPTLCKVYSIVRSATPPKEFQIGEKQHVVKTLRMFSDVTS